MLVGVLAVLMGTARTDTSPSIGRGDGLLAVSSVPAPAEIFIDGRTTGLVTPAVIKSLPTDRKVRLRLEKLGFATYEVDLELDANRKVERMVTLQKLGLVRFSGVSSDAILLVDGNPTDHFDLVELEPGDHELSLEKQGNVIHTERFAVTPGEQTKTIHARE